MQAAVKEHPRAPQVIARRDDDDSMPPVRSREACRRLCFALRAVRARMETDHLFVGTDDIGPVPGGRIAREEELRRNAVVQQAQAGIESIPIAREHDDCVGVAGMGGRDEYEQPIRRSSVSEPCLSSGSLRLPHFGLCTHDGQPRSHGHCASKRAVSSTQPSKTSKPRSAIPTPPECPS